MGSYLRSIWYWVPWQLLLGFLVAGVIFFAATPIWYNACEHRLDLNPTHVCYLTNWQVPK